MQKVDPELCKKLEVNIIKWEDYYIEKCGIVVSHHENTMFDTVAWIGEKSLPESNDDEELDGEPIEKDYVEENYGDEVELEEID
ncbi:hypothetical protein HK098_006951 [Nowakowskiella sp. JEL0407]|nr:hypothetical protein HK098_006951 [Nowakowskiella sp. JEL0407]